MRVIEDSTLFELADALLAAIDFDLDHAFGFHSDLRNPYAKNMEQEYTLFADQGEGRMPSDTEVKRTFIHEIFEEGSRMLFHFDYGDMWEQFYLSVEKMFERALKQLKEMEAAGTEICSLRERLASVVTSTSGIGWMLSRHTL